MKLKKTLWAILGIAAMMGLSSAAFADNLTLVQEAPQTVGPQSTSNPCIIAATQCQQPAGMTFNNFVSSGAISSYNESQEYDFATLRSFVGDVFWVAIDVNTTSAAGEILDAFYVFDDGVMIYSYTADANIGALSSNGNGYADWTLRTVNITGLSGTIKFQAIWNTASDGGESFFLIPQQAPPPPQVPEPASLLLLGMGLTGLGYLRRKSVQK